MELLSILLFSLAVSADGFMVGTAYGIRKIKIPLLSLLVISLASAGAVTLSMLCGKGLSLFLSPQGAKMAGGFMLVLVGLYFLFCACRERISAWPQEDEPLLTFSIKSLGIIILILKEPVKADFDCSGEISSREAFFLGMALAMDAFGAGIGLAMAGFDILFTAALVGMIKFILVKVGLGAGNLVQSHKYKHLSALVSGLIFITIGMLEFF
ncbi:putative sporulation protein YtaF [Thermosyntropha lipolytica DSM 11003]|uniref:Putative sporulation protein YtaF n=1 Tax=Thermosyntropha lipolytica DSM 11003 TaxID=1123382 RepID=A0A1M5MZS6_9FIRM|nr:sporulation membrane protein YtaF [Thermosyntropha lipolytica]SHG82737.1 putative sporulation protein YtaF [Thermosyntropha lipolytica DSM 11003]